MPETAFHLLEMEGARVPVIVQEALRLADAEGGSGGGSREGESRAESYRGEAREGPQGGR